MSRTRIDALAAEEKADLPAWRDRWIEIGLRTGETDWALWKEGARGCYQAAGIHWPGNVVRVSSPIVGALAAPIAASAIAILRRKKAVGDAVDGAVTEAIDEAVGGAVGGAVTEAVTEAVREAVGGAVTEAIDGAVGGAVTDAVRGAVDGAVGGAVGGAVREAVRGAVGGAVREAVTEAVREAVTEAVGGAVREAVTEAVGGAVEISWHYWIGGQFWAAWPALESFFRVLCKLDHAKVAAAVAYEKTVKAASYWWPNKNFVMVSARPTVIRRNVAGQLHADGQLAIEWPDGWGLWMLNGVRVSREIAKTSAEKLAATLVLKEKNAEVRRELVRKIGVERLCAELGATVIDRWKEYELLLLDLGDGRRRTFLKMKNPSLGCYHVEGVPPECKTAREAFLWQNQAATEPEVLT